MHATMEDDDATNAVEGAIAGKRPRKSRAGQPRGGGSVWLPEPYYSEVRARAERAGVTMTDLVRNLVSPPSYSTPSAQSAIPLTQIADRLRSGDVQGARALVHDALRALTRTHAAEVRDDARSWERGDR